MSRSLWMLMALALAAGCGGGEEPVKGAVYGMDGEPLAGALVALNGDDRNLVVTAADGAFKFEDVSTPYKLTVIHEGRLLELHGLKERELRVPVHTYVVPWASEIAGEMEGVQFPLDDYQQVLLSHAGSRLGSTLFVDRRRGDFAGEIFWNGPASLAGDLVAVHLRAEGQGTASFLSKGVRKGLRLEEGTRLSGLGVPLGSEILTRETELIHAPGAYAADYQVFLASFIVNGAAFGPQLGHIPASNTRVTLPSEGGTFRAFGADSDGNQILVSADAVLNGTTRIELPQSVRLKLVQPDGSERVGQRPGFFWTPVHGARSIRLDLLDWKGGREYTFILPGSSDRFDLPDYGYGSMRLSPDSQCDWTVSAYMNDGWSADELGRGRLQGSSGPETIYRSSSFFRTQD